MSVGPLSSGRGAVSYQTFTGLTTSQIDNLPQTTRDQLSKYYIAAKNLGFGPLSFSLAKQASYAIQLANNQYKPPPIADGTSTYAHPSLMKYNLPPHSWSLPITPSALNSTLSRNGTSAINPFDNSPINTKIDHSTRRGIMYRYDNTGTNTGVGSGITSTPPSSGTSTDANIKVSNPTALDDYWGFQFLWNPSTISTVLTRNANVVPSNLDKFSASSGLFTAMEALQFSITINRVNDFAALKGFFTTVYPGVITTFSDFATKYYATGYPTTATQDITQQVTDLLAKGTMADVEYILRMLNGSGLNGQVWVNALNRHTSDLGFLQPVPIAIQFGPNPDSLSYIGWVESLQIKHTQFTEDMIPLHTDIDVTFNAFSRVALVNAGA